MEFCKQKLINPYPTAGENGQNSAGEYDVYLYPHLVGFPASTEGGVLVHGSEQLGRNEKGGS